MTSNSQTVSSSSSSTGTSSATSILSKDHVLVTQTFLERVGMRPENLPEIWSKEGAYSTIIGRLLKVDHIERGRITCTLTVKPPVANGYGSLNGGAVAAIGELVSLACVKSVVVDKGFFLGELAISYMSGAVVNAELEVGGFIVRQGRNVAVTSVEFRVKETKKLVYNARATFYNMPVASL